MPRIMTRRNKKSNKIRAFMAFQCGFDPRHRHQTRNLAIARFL
nr:MAG TPA: hypothetical protein [Caudoviricetes sp.]